MKINNPIASLSRFELALWITSLITVTLSYVFSPERDVLNLICTLIGVTALIFVAKGMVIGQLLSILFAVLYGIISLTYKYYGEMFTYLFMTAPSAVAAVISWLKNPYRDTKTVKVSSLNAKTGALLLTLTAAVTCVSYFLLGWLGTSNLTVSTISVTTSFLASALTVLRSPLYAIAYSANDIVLIAMWILASADNIAYLPMVFCFAMFLINDIYGYINWKRMKKEQG